MDFLKPLLSLQPLNLNHLFSSGQLQDCPELMALKTCPQNPKWHAEGDVLIHTQMVLEEAFKLLPLLSSKEEQLALLLGALLHDIGKPLVTDPERLSAVGHEGAGVVLAGKILEALALPLSLKTLVLGLVRDHGTPRMLVNSNSKARSYRKLALRCSCKMLYYLEVADFRGREGESKEESLAQLETFRQTCESLGLFSSTFPQELQDFENFLRQNTSLPELARKWILHQHLSLWMDGRLRTSLENPFLQKLLTLVHPPWLWYTVGLSGSGKSTWCAQQSPDLYSISTDNTREELTGSPEDHTKEAQVFELCFQRLRLALRQKQSVLWDATHISYRSREHLLREARSLKALVGLVFFPLNPEKSLQNNQKRERHVPDKILQRQIALFNQPHFHEYDYWITLHDPQTSLPDPHTLYWN
jgi:putative nucleotidyltransferase with HDIG domain